MPIRRELAVSTPHTGASSSRRVRFERARGMCQGCGRPHGATVRCLPDGRWYDPVRNTWRDRRGRPARRPDLEQMLRLRTTRRARRRAPGSRSGQQRPAQPGRLCQRCHLTHDRPHHRHSGGSPICSVVLWATCFSGRTDFRQAIWTDRRQTRASREDARGAKRGAGRNLRRALGVGREQR